MKESKYQNKIIKDYEAQGYRVRKTIKSIQNGEPDLTILKAGCIPIFIECKVVGGKVSDLQENRLNEDTRAGFDCYVSWGYDVIPWEITEKKDTDLF